MIIAPKTLFCAVRIAPSIWNSLHAEVKRANDPSVMLFQGQAKTYTDGTTNAALFAQEDWDDHPGPKPTDEEKARVTALLQDPECEIYILNSFAGEHANDRARAAEFIGVHLREQYRKFDGIAKMHLVNFYDGDGRNDKIHEVASVDEDGKTITVSEDNAPSGIYAPIICKGIGYDTVTIFDPHSKLHIQNWQNAFGENNVNALSSLDDIANKIIARHKQAILNQIFRLGAPDGWDKKDDPNKNAATERIKTIANLIWHKMPELSKIYGTPENFLTVIQFGIIKIRRAAYPGAPAKPQVTEFIGNVNGCDCELLDDLADSGGSLLQSGEILLQNGATRVDASICHGPAKADSLAKILDTTTPLNSRTTLIIDNLTITNTMARVEGFYRALSAEHRRRTSLVNSGDEFVKFLTNPLMRELRNNPIPTLRSHTPR